MFGSRSIVADATVPCIGMKTVGLKKKNVAKATAPEIGMEKIGLETMVRCTSMERISPKKKVTKATAPCTGTEEEDQLEEEGNGGRLENRVTVKESLLKETLRRRPILV